MSKVSNLKFALWLFLKTNSCTYELEVINVAGNCQWCSCSLCQKQSQIHFHNKPAASSKQSQELKSQSLLRVLMHFLKWMPQMKLSYSYYKNDLSHYLRCIFLVLYKEWCQPSSHLFAISPHIDPQWLLSITRWWAAASGIIKKTGSCLFCWLPSLSPLATLFMQPQYS